MFEYQIALSFAGEQRSQVEEVAECLKSRGVSVFYDNYEKSSLWGKDLYQHLSDVYRKKAQYCIIFASQDYARKAWTSHELKSAQARAFEEKGGEYILPVRFDSTEIPGILPTVGYLDFHEEGPGGICAAALEKLGLRTPPPIASESQKFKCDYSPRALILPSALPTRLFPTIQQAVWGREIELLVVAQGSEHDSWLSRFRNHPKSFALAYGFDVALAKLASAERRTEGGESSWTLKFVPERTEFSNDLEMGTSSMTADQFAERRIRRLLLNEGAAVVLGETSDSLAAANQAMDESLVRGLNSIVKIERSDFPPLYKEFGEDPAAFLEIAWISAIASLKLSAAVEQIDHLKLALEGTTLKVRFKGRRHRKYVNVDPYEIEISGQLSLV